MSGCLKSERVESLSQLRSGDMVKYRPGSRGRFDLGKVGYNDGGRAVVNDRVDRGVHSSVGFTQETSGSEIKWGQTPVEVRRPGKLSRLLHRRTRFSYGH